MSFILLGIQHLFTDIDPENFMEPYIGMQYQKDSQSFDKIAKEWVNKYSTWFFKYNLNKDKKEGKFHFLWQDFLLLFAQDGMWFDDVIFVQRLINLVYLFQRNQIKFPSLRKPVKITSNRAMQK